MTSDGALVDSDNFQEGNATMTLNQPEKLDREKLCWRLLGVAVLALALMGAASPFTVTHASAGKHITIKAGGAARLVRSGSVDMSRLPTLSRTNVPARGATRSLPPATLSPMTPSQQQAWAQAVKSGKVHYPQVIQRMVAPKVAAKPTNTPNTPNPNFDACGYTVFPCEYSVFDGLTSTQTGGFAYPSITIGSNPSYVLEGVNAALVVYKFSPQVFSGPVSASSFFGSVLQSGDTMENSQVFWDATRLHWIIVMEEYGVNGSGDSVSYLDIAVSKTQNVTLNPATQYYVYQMQTNEGLGGTAGNWCDNPTLGGDYWGAWISCNAYDAVTNGFVGNIVFGLSKNALYTGSFTGFFWKQIPAPNGSDLAFNMSPASEDGTPDAEFLIATDEGWSASNDQGLTTCAWSGTHQLATGAQPSLSCVINSAILPVGYTEPNDASQPGKPQSLYPGYGAKQVLYKNGAIDFAMTTAVSSSYDGIFWAEVQPQLSGLNPAQPQQQVAESPLVRQAGVFSIVGTKIGSYDAFMPTYFPSSEDDGVLVFNYSSTSKGPDVAVTGRRATDAPGNMGDGGQWAYYQIGGLDTDGHWGVYAGCSLDTNLTSRGLIWCGSEFVGANTSAIWSTFIAGYRVE